MRCLSLWRRNEEKMKELKIEYVKVDDLVPYALNTREHDDYDVAQIRKSIEQYGFNDPIGIWRDNIIIEGHGRLLAAKSLGLETVPVIRLDHMTDEQRRAYGIMHNKTAELSAWDFEKLELELQDLDFSMFNIDFDLPSDKEKDNKDKRPEVPFTEVLGEESNYLVLKFDTEVDWLQACTFFDVKPVKALSTRKDGKITGKMTRIGTGRVLNGSEALERLRGGVG